MKKEKIILQLGVEIDTIKAHIQRLKRDNYKLHQLDVELLQQKTRQLYDMLFELENEVETQSIASPHSKSIASPHSKSIASPHSKSIAPPPPKNIASPPQKTETEKVTETPRPKEEVVAKPEKKIVEPPPTVVEKVEEKTPEKPAKETEAVREKVPLVVVETKEIAEEKQPEPIVKDEAPQAKIETPIEKQADVKSNFDLFSESGSATVSDKFTGNDKQSLADKMQGSKVSDLRQSIGINEKFLFINELFNGDMGRYNKAVDELNDLQTLKGAETFLLELKIQNQWDDELDAFLKLKDLSERKFK